MASAASVAMVLVVVAAIVSSGLPAAHAGTSFITRTCRTQDAALCVGVLSADPRSARTYTVHGLADIALYLATRTALENAWAVNLLRFKYAPWTPNGNATSLCGAAYVDAARELVFGARDSFDDGDYGGASQLVASGQRAVDRCEDAFKEVGAISPVTDANRQMTEHCVVARGLIDRLASTSCSCSCSQSF